MRERSGYTRSQFYNEFNINKLSKFKRVKKLIVLLGFFLSCVLVNAQKKTNTKKEKDSLKPTPIINVITSYTPTLSDAYKARKNPVIKLSKKSEKQQLQYTIFSAPVASTFIPKSGVVKGIDVGIKERLYNNYIAAGFGNNTTPFFEFFLRKSRRFKHDFGVYGKYLSSENSITDTPLNSNFSNLNAGAYYQKTTHYFDWRIGFNAIKNEYNWYGLPNLPFTTATINGIEATQTYTGFELTGALIFEDSYIQDIQTSITLYSDAFTSNEFLLLLNPNFQFPLKRFGRNFNDLQLATSVEILKGDFNKNYADVNPVSYNTFTARVHPFYKFTWKDFVVKAGVKGAISIDAENSANNLFMYPDVEILYPIVKDYASIFVGATGNLTTNTYQNLTTQNPYASPTLFITQTHEKQNFFGGLKGKLSPDIGFHLKGTYKTEEDKILWVRNNSKSDGTISISNDIPLENYEYGNSFSVVYDDVTTLTIFSELEVDVTKRLATGFNAQFHTYTLTHQAEAWNLPTLEASLFAKYKTNTWYAGIDGFFVGERKERTYNGIYPATIDGAQTLEAYIDLNANGGYHFNDKFSVFLKLNNILNTEYQRFANFTVQGFIDFIVIYF